MTWKGREATEIIAWFQYECDPSLNSNVFQVASYVVQKHFPGKTVSFVMLRYPSGNMNRTQSC
jgi:deubiquitinating protein VCIP135